jgi:hypothetical protein
MLHELGADINAAEVNESNTPLSIATRYHKIYCIRTLITLGAVINSRAIEAAAHRNSSHIRKMLQGVAGVVTAATAFMRHRPYCTTTTQQQQPTRHDRDQGSHAAGYAVIMQKRLCLAPFELVTLAKQQPLKTMCIAIISAQPEQPSNGPADAILLAGLVNLLMRSDLVRDLHNLRMVCKTTLRRSFPVPHQRHLELPVGVIESFLAGDYSAYLPFHCVYRARLIQNDGHHH